MGDAAIFDLQDHPPVKFPQEWTVFSRNFEATFGYTMEVGIERDHPLFAVRIHSNFLVFGRPALVLHSGPTKDGPRIGMVKDATLNPLKTHDFDVFVPKTGSRMLDDDESANVKIEVRAHMMELFPVHRLSVAVGKDGRAEDFEWRHVIGKEASDLVGGMAAGWTLVRVPSSEVVAVWAPGYKAKKEAMRFRLLNSGVSGQLGDTFESVAVITALGCWDHVRRERQKNPDHGGQAMIQL